jgi:exosome complex component RRP42
MTKDYVISLLNKGFRLDERKFDQYRDIKVEYGISAKSAEGSAKVTIGKTEVVAGVKLEVGTPYSDRPDEGSIMVNMELLPLSSPEFESGPPSIESIEISRVVDRAIREGHALNFKKLSIKSGEKMWNVIIDIYPLNDRGNLFDAASLAAIAAIKDAKFPKMNAEYKVDYNERTKTSLPLEKLPLSCTVLKIGEHFIIDPLPEEEASIDARLTVGVLENGEVCSLQKGDNSGLSIKDIQEMISLAVKKTKEMRKAL